MWTTNRKNHRGLLAILILVVAAPPLATFAAPQSAPTNETIVLKDVRVIDGSGAPPMEHAAIVIEGSRIVSVGPLGKLKWPKSARVIDYAGKTFCRDSSPIIPMLAKSMEPRQVRKITIAPTSSASCTNTRLTA
jgi:hypothetical protein